MKIAHYPEPFSERFPSIERPPQFTKVGPHWQVQIDDDTWEIEATSVAAALRQARQLQKLKRENAI